MDFSDEEECDKLRLPCGTVPVTESDIAMGAGYGSVVQNNDLNFQYEVEISKMGNIDHICSPTTGSTF